jgi:hypothetical protein
MFRIELDIAHHCQLALLYGLNIKCVKLLSIANLLHRMVTWFEHQMFSKSLALSPWFTILFEHQMFLKCLAV